MKKWRVSDPAEDQTGYDPDRPWLFYDWFDTEEEAREYASTDTERKVEEIEVIEFYGAVTKAFVEQELKGNLLNWFSYLCGHEHLSDLVTSEDYEDTHWAAVRSEMG